MAPVGLELMRTGAESFHLSSFGLACNAPGLGSVGVDMKLVIV